MSRCATSLIVLSLGTLGCEPRNEGDLGSPRPLPYSEASVALQSQILHEGFFIPFDVAVVSDDEFFITDRIGKLFHYRQGSVDEILGVPRVSTFNDPGLSAIIHGGLMGVALHPNYPERTVDLHVSYFADGWLRDRSVSSSGRRRTET